MEKTYKFWCIVSTDTKWKEPITDFVCKIINKKYVRVNSIFSTREEARNIVKETKKAKLNTKDLEIRECKITLTPSLNN